jgi:hypothetical protein
MLHDTAVYANVHIYAYNVLSLLSVAVASKCKA